MSLPIIVAIALGGSSPASDVIQSCLIGEVSRLAADRAQAAELRRLTRWEATRLLWSLAGDSARCAGQTRATTEQLNAAYRHADRLVVRHRLYRD